MAALVLLVILAYDRVEARLGGMRVEGRDVKRDSQS